MRVAWVAFSLSRVANHKLSRITRKLMIEVNVKNCSTNEIEYKYILLMRILWASISLPSDPNQK